MIQLINITKEFGSKTVLDNINLHIADKDRGCIVGNNGEGKTTLLNIILGQIKPDSGQVVLSNTCGYLPQNAKVNLSLLDRLNDVNYASEFYFNLSNLNFTQEFVFTEERIKRLSCGEQTKIYLADVLAQNPDTLILDEPTNHLDMTTKKALIRVLNDFEGSIVLVSHDVDFINKTMRKIIEIKSGHIQEYEGNFDAYLAQKENAKLRIAREYEKHQKRVKEINAQIDMYKRASAKSEAQKSNAKKNKAQGGGWGFFRQDIAMKKLSTFAGAKIKQLEHELDKDVAKPEKEHVIRYKLTKDDLKTPFAYIAKDLGKSFGDKVLFEHSDFTIRSGDKVGLIGDNGVGKSTLFNILLGKDTYSGRLDVAGSVKPVLMQQDVYDLDFNITINEMSQMQDKDYRTNFLLNLTTMGLDKSRFDTHIGALSSGEKMKIKLTQIILSDANVIFLDEPTNHLDVANKIYLEKVLAGFCGSIIIISHDVRFLDNVTTRTLEIKNKKIIEKY